MELRNSRLETTSTLARKIADATNPPKVFVSSSAVGKAPGKLCYIENISQISLEQTKNGIHYVLLYALHLAQEARWPHG